MARAMELARQAAGIGEVPVGAVVYRGDQVLGQGMNLRERDEDPTAHAEIVAMRAAARAINCWRLDDCSLAVTLEPCPMCAGAMVNARLPRLVYGAADPKMGCVDTLYQLCTESRFNHRLTVVRGVMAEESASLLREFFRQRRG
ncbi:MAG: nucleoside deaminase [Phycisphaeraceae bacterium]|nr:nucleoside deaminase [Phycisphaeraceae bacterium]